MKYFRVLMTALCVSVPILTGAQPAGPYADAPLVADAWSRAATSGQTGVLYMTITGSSEADRLTGVATSAAARAELHQSAVDHGIMRMRPIDALPVAGGQTVRLQPGGTHVMLLGLTHALHQGDTLAFTLTFEHAGEVAATAVIRSPAFVGDGMVPGGSPSDGQGGSDMPMPR